MSPFLHKTLFGPFKEGTERQVVPEEDEGAVPEEDEGAVRKVMELACGRKGGVHVRDVQEMVRLGAVADQSGMEEEVVLEAVAEWIKAGEGEAGGGPRR